MLTALLLFACASEPDDDLLASFARDPRATRDHVLALQDPVRREAAILRLSEAYPGRVGPLCGELPKGQSRAYCQRLAARPHLASPLDKQTPRDRRHRERAGGGPSTPTVPISQELLETWQEQQADPGPCRSEDATYHPCLSQRALEAARKGDAHAAAAACSAAREERWQRDCFFSTAEDLAGVPGAYPTAASLCLGSASFVHECNGHLLMRLSPRRPGAPSFAVHLKAGAQQVRGAWHELDPQLIPTMVDLYWATVSERFYEPQRPVNGDLFDQLPAEAWPHVRAALAWQLANCPDPLAALSQATQRRGDEGVACRAPVDSPRDASKRSRIDQEPDKGFAMKGLRWARDLQGEETIPAVFFLVQGAGRRPTSDDAELDLLLAGLIVQAYRNAPPLDLFAAQLDDERFVLRWTAARILAELDPEHPALEKAARDEDPRVRRRAAGPDG